MASLSFFFLLLLLLPLAATSSYPPMTLTIVNNCPFTIWPAIQPNSGLPVLERGGFALPTLAYRSFPAPCAPWSGRIWARTGCSSPARSPCFSCATGDCAGRLQCAGAGGTPPATLAQISIHSGPKDLSIYSVSLVDGFNLPMTVTPHEGTGACPVVGCREDLLPTCPECLKVRAAGAVVGCKSGCGAFNTDELCCRNAFAIPGKCRASSYSAFFKNSCPDTYTFAQDATSLWQQCSAPKELKVIFCH